MLHPVSFPCCCTSSCETETGSLLLASTWCNSDDTSIRGMKQQMGVLYVCVFGGVRVGGRWLILSYYQKKKK